MDDRGYGGMVQGGREITARQVEEICLTVEMCGGLSRGELARTICEHLGWYTATGSLKVDAGAKLLEKLEGRGVLQLPPKRAKAPGGAGRLQVTSRSNPGAEVVGVLKDLGEVGLEAVWANERTAVWNEYVERYHFLGYKRPFGCFLRYFIVSARGVVGCVLFSGAAKALGARDRWIGWSERQRLCRLPWVVNNSRFLIFPWVRVKNLASHVLGQVGGRIGLDWAGRWGYAPVLMETFVDPRDYEGSCYKAANWEYVGMTTGEGLVRPGKQYCTSAKKIFVKPLVKDFRQWLCGDGQVRR